MENLPVRKRTRLKGYDYSLNGAYFITLCSKDKKPIFGFINRKDAFSEPKTYLSEYGKAIENQIREINEVYKNIDIRHYAIMPTHLHFIVFVNGSSGTPTPTNATVPQLISTLKRLTNKRCGQNLWQRGYNDHIIRDDDDYLRVWQYIYENPYGKG